MGTFYGKVVKRLLDVAGSGLLLVALSPALAVLALLVAMRLGRPVFFRQQRPGRDGKVFGICKFRTMTEERNAAGEPLPDADRLTEFGAFLRRTSLDELPELVNILKGDMSFVGPRPLLVKYLPLYSPEQARRHAVRPGLTGWAQVNGRNAVAWEQKFQYDVWYVDHLSFGLDMKILGRTVKTVIGKKDVSQAGSVTTEEFLGNAKRPEQVRRDISVGAADTVGRDV
ncbi:MAG: sugar transferase [Clostridiales Family XIII bacterium]|jgi:lipopolysaccharide/colanic/teichoic acid biosynthesis glycosyltransferase|nr:sugar transferase [Clostridiales Family XIII bacterium]